MYELMDRFYKTIKENENIFKLKDIDLLKINHEMARMYMEKYNNCA